MKVKIFSDKENYGDLEKKINKWLYENKVRMAVIDIKYCDTPSIVSALIMYKEV